MENSDYQHDDKQYWEDYYSVKKHPNGPSDFAKFVLTELDGNHRLCELGCGNGRDSVYFSEQGNHDVLGIDQCDTEMEFLQNNYGNDSLKFMSYKLSELPDFGPFDSIYARWLLHAITEEEEDMLLPWIYENLATGGVFYSESRSIKCSLFGEGTYVGNNAYVIDHYRRFMDSDVFTNKLLIAGFEIEHMVESQGLAVYKDDDPVVIRILARKV